VVDIGKAVGLELTPTPPVGVGLRDKNEIVGFSVLSSCVGVGFKVIAEGVTCVGVGFNVITEGARFVGVGFKVIVDGAYCVGARVLRKIDGVGFKVKRNGASSEGARVSSLGLKVGDKVGATSSVGAKEFFSSVGA